MRGVADRQRVEREKVLYGAWVSDFFRRQDKLKAFSQYAKTMLPQQAKRIATGAELLAQFEAIRAAGVPMTIRKLA